ncbi:hypothetical protein BH23BAC1_BH23BAC1_48080 [soil metagenome]
MYTSIKIITVLFLSILISCGSPERNETNQTAAAQENAEVEVGVENLEEDEDYLVSAHLNSQLQMALGSVAVERSNTPEIQQFGQRVVNSNQIIKNNITELASGVDIELSPAMSTKYTNLLDSIQGYSGHEFDSAFLNTVIEEHDEDIERFTTLSKRTNNPILREILTNNLEILHRQRNEAEDLKDRLNIDN